jgi:hypothetical protein
MSLGHDNLSGGQGDFATLAAISRRGGRRLASMRSVSRISISGRRAGLLAWLDAGCHGQMDYMYKHGLKRSRPAELVPAPAASSRYECPTSRRESPLRSAMPRESLRIAVRPGAGLPQGAAQSPAAPLTGFLPRLRMDIASSWIPPRSWKWRWREGRTGLAWKAHAAVIAQAGSSSFLERSTRTAAAR